MRALFVALDRWVSDGTGPPDSRVPRLSDGTAVFSVPRARHRDRDRAPGRARLPGHSRRHLHRPGSPPATCSTSGRISTAKGSCPIQPPDFVGAPIYPSFVSKTDEDGNELAGIRLPTVAAPTGTTTGWALRRAEFGLNEGCESAGQYIPFATTEAERLASGDPRPSLEERYGNNRGYVRAVARSARQLAREGLLLREGRQEIHRGGDPERHSEVRRQTHREVGSLHGAPPPGGAFCRRTREPPPAGGDGEARGGLVASSPRP